MKKNLSFIVAAILLIGIDAYFVSCSNAKASNVDVVNGTQPVDVHDIQWKKQFIASLKPLSPVERKTRIDQVVPRLNTQLVENLRERGFGCEIKSITYVFGSGTAKEVASGDGNTYNGHFDDQLYAVIKGGDCFKDSLMAFVQCFNGVFVIEGDNQETIGTYAPVFTIGKGWGINRYVEYLNSVWLAEVFGIPLHEGQGWDGKIITPARARELYNQLGETAVTVEVYEGDVFDLGNMTYTHFGKVLHAKPH
jgi:hypothetical protein